MQHFHTVTSLGLSQQSRVLLVMPHPDDEAVFASGLIAGCTHHGIPLKIVTSTRGEASTLRYGLAAEADLAAARRQELATALKILRVDSGETWTFPDGGLEKSQPKLAKLLQKELQTYQPTDVFCLEPDGIYGHPDHVALTEVVIRSVSSPIKLWFITVAPWYTSSSAKHMAKKSVIQPIAPEICLHLGVWQIWLKFLAIAAHRSQFQLLPWQGDTFWHFWRNSIWWSEFFTLRK